MIEQTNEYIKDNENQVLHFLRCFTNMEMWKEPWSVRYKLEDVLMRSHGFSSPYTDTESFRYVYKHTCGYIETYI